MSFIETDLSTWKRREYYEHYMSTVRCAYSVTTELDATYPYIKSRMDKVNLFPMFMHSITKAVNNREEFRYAFNSEGKLGHFDRVNPAYTVMRKDEPEYFCNVWTEYNDDYEVFYESYKKDCEYAENAGCINSRSVPENVLHISYAPGLYFTSFSLQMFDMQKYLMPIFTIGEFCKVDKKIMLPVSIQANHAICDGFHVNRLVKEIEENFNTFR